MAMTNPDPPTFPPHEPNATRPVSVPPGINPPKRHNRILLIALVAVVAIAIATITFTGLFTLGDTVARHNPLAKDPGITACESIRDHPNSAKPATLTQADYQAVRAQLGRSRYDDLRTSGTQLLDLAWQANAASPSDLGSALVLIGPLVNAYAVFSGACAAHNVILPPLLSSTEAATTPDAVPSPAPTAAPDVMAQCRQAYESGDMDTYNQLQCERYGN
jgi:hypothetical protein